MKLRELLSEAPLQDFRLFGDRDVPGSFRSDDLRAATNKKWLTKLGTAFSKTPHKFNIYMLNAPLVGNTATHTRADDNEVKINIGLDHYRDYSGKYTARAFNHIFGFVPPDHEQSISVLFTFNEGAQRIPFTQWMIAHRFMHAVVFHDAPDATRIMGTIRDIHSDLIQFACCIQSAIAENEDEAGALFANMTTKSAYAGRLVGNTKAMRTSNMTNAGEWFPEHGAEFLIKGKITLRRPDLGGTTVYNRDNYGTNPMNAAEVNDHLQSLEDRLNKEYQALFARCIGGIFVV